MNAVPAAVAAKWLVGFQQLDHAKDSGCLSSQADVAANVEVASGNEMLFRQCGQHQHSAGFLDHAHGSKRRN